MRVRTVVASSILCLSLLTVLAILDGCAQSRPKSYSPEGRLDSTLPGALAGAPPAAERLRPRGKAPARDVDADGIRDFDDLLVIERTDKQNQFSADAPGSGVLIARLDDKSKPAPVPLKHTDVRASVVGYIATVDVKQQYHNPYNSKIEAVYVFPLPTDAAVTDFVMTIGDRHIRGIIREREEAQRIYSEAKRQGYVASLMTQERPNVFTQNVANIEPGKQIDVDIKYFNALTYGDGWYEFAFPMVVGPRFNPQGSTDGIGAKAHGSAVGSTGQQTEISYLRPDQRSGHDISLALDIDAGVNIEQLDSRNHAVDVKTISPTHAQVTLKSEDSIPNKDFVLRYKVAGDRVKTAMMTQRTAKGTYFTLMIFPPESLKGLPRKPLEMIYTIDVSGSMSGRPIEQAKAATAWALKHMQPGDTFQIVSFANSASQMSAAALPATEENVTRGLRYLAQEMHEGGGTMMLEGIRRSLDFPHDENRLRFVTFLTDGFIGNEREILSELHKCLGPSRVFSFGVGSSTNRYLLDSMARLGDGAAAYLGLNDDAEKVMAAHFERISHPALTDVSIDFGDLKVGEVYPRKLPDLFVGRPVIVTGLVPARTRSGSSGSATVRVSGRVGGEAQSFAIPVRVDDAENSIERSGIASVWARMKIGDIYDRATWDEAVVHDAPQQVKQVALEYGLMSAYTSFVAVDSTQHTAGSFGTTVSVPVQVPEGVKYETTVPER